MCGITGCVRFDGHPVDRDALRLATALLAHRGPDGEGRLLLDTRGATRASIAPDDAAPADARFDAALGHRRLAIIDLSERAAQPMVSDDGAVALCYNGEVYNYRELRAELEAEGARFHSDSDTEVVLRAYLRWGTACFARFNGMWGLALLDRRTRVLVLSRDRFGVKPLYVHRDARRVVFGSEIKAVLAWPGTPHAPFFPKLRRYLAGHYRYVDGGGETFFSDVIQVEPASFVEIDFSGRERGARYFDLDPDAEAPTQDECEIVERFLYLLTDAVRLRMRADVPVGCMLSGGMDSASIATLAARLTAKALRTFSALYEPCDPYDERDFIRAVVQDIGADAAYTHPSRSDLRATLGDMLAIHDEPVCTATWLSHYLAMKDLARLPTPVILTGYGGDELLAGYWDHYHYRFFELDRQADAETDPHRARALRAEREHEIARWRERHHRDPAELERFAAHIARTHGRADLEEAHWTRYEHCLNADFARDFSISRRTRGARRGFSLRGNGGHGIENARQERRASKYRDPLRRRLDLELRYETVLPILRPEDRNSMAFSRETRVPFLDYRLVEFCFSLPGRYKIRDGIGKWILREAMRGLLVESVRTRGEKVGFNAPIARWLRTKDREALSDLLADSELARRGITDAKAVRAVADEHLAERADHAMFLWHFINAELWIRRFSPSGS